MKFRIIAAMIALALARKNQPRKDPAGARRIVNSMSVPPMNGSALRMTLVEVTYAPGEGTPLHSHACPVMVYVVSGHLLSRVRGENERSYGPGESFYEQPGSAHELSKNKRNTRPVKLVAMFLCDHDAPLITLGEPNKR